MRWYIDWRDARSADATEQARLQTRQSSPAPITAVNILSVSLIRGTPHPSQTTPLDADLISRAGLYPATMNKVNSIAPAGKTLRPHIDFMSKRHVAMALSMLLIVICLISLAWQSLQLGLDFTSGQAVRVRLEQAVASERVADALEQTGYPDVRVTAFGSDREFRIVMPIPKATESLDPYATGEAIRATIQQVFAMPVSLEGSDFISARAGADLVEKSGLGLLVALGGVTTYISLRFQFKFAIAALAALTHDVILTVGFFSLLRLQFDFTVLAAIMAVIGYSLNDTIIIADRIRENFRRLRHLAPFDLINISINQTLSRTLITSGTTLMVVLVLLMMGGEMIRGFAIAMTVGIVVGTYSSIYVASALLLTLKVSRLDLVPAETQGEGADGN